MLNWTKRNSSGTEKESVSKDKSEKNESNSGLFKLGISVVGVYLLGAIIVGWYWSQEPDSFMVKEVVAQAAKDSGRKVVNGYTTAETLKHIVNTLLNKPGGYLSNDVAPPGVWLDNIPSWEYGVLVQVRDLSRALRKDFARSQSQSTEDPDLAKAEPSFNFDSKSWALPASEQQYRKGVKSLDRYLARLTGNAKPTAHFYSRADNLNNWLGDASTRLGSLSQRLSASIGRVHLNYGLLDDPSVVEDGVANTPDGKTYETPWMQIDNIFYEARGQAWALSHMLRAIEIDFSDVLANKNALVSVQQIIQDLDATQATVWSPMILNGSGYGLMANHSLVIANYISRASAGIIDLRQLLSQG